MVVSAPTLLIGLLLVAAACDTGAPTELRTAGGPRVVDTRPRDGQRGIARRTRFRIRFDRPLAPDSVGRDTVRVESGPQRLRLSVRTEPVRRTVVARSFDGRAMAPQVVYRLTIDGVRDLGERPLPEPVTASFHTGSELGELPPPPSASWTEVRPILRSGCVGDSGCHGADAPALGLDLSSAAGVRRTAVGAPAAQVATGAAGSEGVAAARGLAGLPIIDATSGSGRPARSYLLYKVLGDPHIIGDPMPPGPPEARLSRAQQKRLSDWILAGAPTE